MRTPKEFHGRAHGSASLLRLHGDHGAGGGKRQQRQFFKRESRPGERGIPGVRFRGRFAVRPAHSRQRPIIEQEQDERERDHHRLGGESGEEESCHRQIPLPVRLSRVPSVGPEGEEEEHCAQDILALRHPCNRLDIDRMNREQHCHEEAGAEATGGPHQQKKSRSAFTACSRMLVK